MARIGNTRGRGSLRRKPGRKPPRAVTLIVCEGDSERIYFNTVRIHLRLTAAEVVIPNDSSGTAPINLVRYAERQAREQGGYDHIFLVFDRDGHESFQRARDEICRLAQQRKPFREAISVPCFELWLLMHHERTDRPFSGCDEIIHTLRRHIPGYVKADARIAEQLLPLLTTAIENGRWLKQQGLENPYTSVHQLLEHLQAVAAQEHAA